jgi:hypothetical protein
MYSDQDDLVSWQERDSGVQAKGLPAASVSLGLAIRTGMTKRDLTRSVRSGRPSSDGNGSSVDPHPLLPFDETDGTD